MQSRVGACLSQTAFTFNHLARRNCRLNPQLSMEPPFPRVGLVSVKQMGSVCGRGRDFWVQPAQCKHSSRPQRGPACSAPLGGRRAIQQNTPSHLAQPWARREAGVCRHSLTSGFTQMLRIFSPQVFHKLYFRALFSNCYHSPPGLHLKCALPFDSLTFSSPSHVSQKALHTQSK